MSTISAGNTSANAGVVTGDTTGTLFFSAANNLIRCSGTGAIVLPSGTSSTRPTNPVNGMIRYSTSSNRIEGYANNIWVGFF